MENSEIKFRICQKCGENKIEALHFYRSKICKLCHSTKRKIQRKKDYPLHLRSMERWR